MLSKLLGLKAYFITALVAAVIAGAAGYGVAWKIQSGNIAKIELAHERAVTKAVAAARAEERAAEAISDQIGGKAAAEAARIRSVTRTIVREVPVHVSPQADARCVVPAGAVRVLDAAAAGSDPPAVPDAAGQPDDAPSGVELSTVVASVADNYGAYHEVAAQLRALQDWIRAQQALADQATEGR